jgi:hypothetical protein
MVGYMRMDQLDNTTSAGAVAAASEVMDQLMAGGKKHRRSKTAKRSKSKRSMKHTSSRRRGSKRMSKKVSKKGGMGAGFGAVLKEALVPFGIFALQKNNQKKTHAKRKTFRKFRRTSKR